MQARGPLMVEHRLIERVIALIDKRAAMIRSTAGIDPLFVDAVVDFLRTYADRTHHGKEEDILFRELETRSLSADDRRVMHELVQDHVLARQTTKSIVEANLSYRSGNGSTIREIMAGLETLVGLYPGHIAKEDNVFFPAARAYFTEDEDQALLAAFWDFDRKMIHEKYKSVVGGLEQGPEGR